MIVATYTLVTNGSFISERTGRERPSGNPSTHLSSLSAPPASAPGREPPLRAGVGAAAAPGPSRRGCLRPAPRGHGMRSRPGAAPRGGRDPLGAAPQGRGGGGGAGGVPPPTPPFSRRTSPGRRSLWDRAEESSPRPRSALAEFGGVAYPPASPRASAEDLLACLRNK